MTEQTCPVCGKVFYMEPGLWAYKLHTGPKPIGLTWMCSWHCLQQAKAEKSRHKGGQGSYRRKPVRCTETGERWDSVTEAAERLDVKRDQIHRAIRNKTVLFAPCRDAMHLEWA